VWDTEFHGPDDALVMLRGPRCTHGPTFAAVDEIARSLRLRATPGGKARRRLFSRR
jgi:hypothetical protein